MAFRQIIGLYYNINVLLLRRLKIFHVLLITPFVSSSLHIHYFHVFCALYNILYLDICLPFLLFITPALDILNVLHIYRL
jgi:hypothetical protein